MRLYKTNKGAVVEVDESYYLSEFSHWDLFINRRELHGRITTELRSLKPDTSLQSLIKEELQPPIGTQEVWAAGVTYMRSLEARKEESAKAGGDDFYTKVYSAERPELFFKSAASRTVGSGQQVRIRKDSKWNVPEPELTLFITSQGTIEGYTIGNDMSSRDIEGENPLYLPQAKSYDGSSSIGPCIYLDDAPIAKDTLIQIVITRKNNIVFQSAISIQKIKRTFEELVSYLFRETSFPYGVFLMTGTGIVPPDDFTLQPNDKIDITISMIGTLTNIVS